MLGSLGVQTRWLGTDNDLEIVPPKELNLTAIDEAAARRTRSVTMFGPLLHRTDTFDLPYAGGCNLGTRTVEPHMAALRPFGLEVKASVTAQQYAEPKKKKKKKRYCSSSCAASRRLRSRTRSRSSSSSGRADRSSPAAYRAVDAYRLEGAERALRRLGSTAGTAKDVVDAVARRG